MSPGGLFLTEEVTCPGLHLTLPTSLYFIHPEGGGGSRENEGGREGRREMQKEESRMGGKEGNKEGGKKRG